MSGRLRKQRKANLKILIGNYEKALKNAKTEKTKEDLRALIKKAEDEIKGIN